MKKDQRTEEVGCHQPYGYTGAFDELYNQDLIGPWGQETRH